MTKKTNPDKFKNFFTGLHLSTSVILIGILCVIAAPVFGKVLQITYEKLPLHWLELSFGWGIVFVGILTRIIDKWDGKIKKGR